MSYDLVVVGGGAAGIFAAIQCAQLKPGFKILVLERSGKLLSKVKISGGGRCNVTHNCDNPREMINYYPRGGRELLGPFHTFMSGEMVQWLKKHGVHTKVEADGRIFPVSDNSQSIIDCFLEECRRLGVKIENNCPVTGLSNSKESWKIQTATGEVRALTVLIATGSNFRMWQFLSELGHQISAPVPSLFTFNISDPLIAGIPGISVDLVRIRINGSKYEEEGPLLITHWGLSGPAVLKLSARAARWLAECQYQFEISINWINRSPEAVVAQLETLRRTDGSRKIANTPLFGLSKRLWMRIIEKAGLVNSQIANLRKSETSQLVTLLTNSVLAVQGKSTFKEEFVTCGGVSCRDIDFRRMESRYTKGLYFAGEVIDIDALTGGFNFQAAWTTAVVAARAITQTSIV